MSLTAIFFLAIVFTGFSLGFIKSPFYALIAYIFIYFICPNPSINWWAKDVPQLRWSLLAAGILGLVVVFNSHNLNNIQLVTNKVGWWLSAFLVLSIIVSFGAINPERSFSKCYDFFRYVVIFYLMIKCIKTERELFVVVFLLLLFGFILGYFAYGHPRYAGRLEGVGTPDTADSNGLALLLVTLLPFVLPVLLCSTKKVKYCIALFVAFILNGIVLCNSRGAIVALGGSFFCMFLMSKHLAGLRWKMVVVGIMAICAFAYLADEQFISRFETIAASSSTDRGSGRLDVWIYGLKMAQDFPFGVGGGGFQLLSPQYMPREILTTGGVRSSHNTYLLILVEQGYLGVLIYLGFFSQLFFDLRSARKTLLSRRQKTDVSKCIKEKKFLYSLNIALTSALVGHIIGAFLGNRLYYEFIYYLAALVVLVKFFSLNTEAFGIDKKTISKPSLDLEY